LFIALFLDTLFKEKQLIVQIKGVFHPSRKKADENG
jgi:hypothetical protein